MKKLLLLVTILLCTNIAKAQNITVLNNNEIKITVQKVIYGTNAKYLIGKQVRHFNVGSGMECIMLMNNDEPFYITNLTPKYYQDLYKKEPLTKDVSNSYYIMTIKNEYLERNSIVKTVSFDDEIDYDNL